MNRFDTSHSTPLQRLWQILLRCCVWLLLLSIVIVAGVMYFALEQTPLVAVQQTVSSQDAKTAADFIKRISRKIINTHDPIVIQAGAHEINCTLHVAHRTYSGFAGNTSLSNHGAEFKISVRTQVLGRYYFLNGEATLKTSPQGFRWSKSKIGSVPLSDGMANFLFYRLVETALGKEYGNKILTGVSDIAVTPTHISLIFEPPHGFQKGIATVVERFNSYIGQEKKFDSARVQHYLDVLVDYTRQHPDQSTSLTEYLTLLLDEAYRQSQQHGFTAREENLSSLYALGIQVGPGVFRHFVADIQLHRLNATPQPQLTLQNRADLAKHFVYSAALKILAEQGFSFSLGELKEILDANGNGSGFSFVDITADKVGIRYTELAIGSEKSAQALQRIGATGIRERDIFPDVMALPEGLSEQEFQRYFNDVESDTYQALLQEIDLRINQMELFQRFIDKGME